LWFQINIFSNTNIASVRLGVRPQLLSTEQTVVSK